MNWPEYFYWLSFIRYLFVFLDILFRLSFFDRHFAQPNIDWCLFLGCLTSFWFISSWLVEYIPYTIYLYRHILHTLRMLNRSIDIEQKYICRNHNGNLLISCAPHRSLCNIPTNIYIYSLKFEAEQTFPCNMIFNDVIEQKNLFLSLPFYEWFSIFFFFFFSILYFCNISRVTTRLLSHALGYGPTTILEQNNMIFFYIMFVCCLFFYISIQIGTLPSVRQRSNEYTRWGI